MSQVLYHVFNYCIVGHFIANNFHGIDFSVDGSCFAAFDSLSTQNPGAFAGVNPTLLAHADNQFSSVFLLVALLKVTLK